MFVIGFQINHLYATILYTIIQFKCSIIFTNKQLGQLLYVRLIMCIELLGEIWTDESAWYFIQNSNCVRNVEDIKKPKVPCAAVLQRIIRARNMFAYTNIKHIIATTLLCGNESLVNTCVRAKTLCYKTSWISSLSIWF